MRHNQFGKVRPNCGGTATEQGAGGGSPDDDAGVNPKRAVAGREGRGNGAVMVTPKSPRLGPL